MNEPENPAGVEPAPEAPIPPGNNPADNTDRTRVQGSRESVACPRCGDEKPAQGFCPDCGAAPAQPQGKLITGSPTIDRVLGFLTFCSCCLLPALIVKNAWSFSLIIGLAPLGVSLVTIVILSPSPRFRYRAFSDGMKAGAILLSVLLLGAIVTCFAQLYNSLLRTNGFVRTR